MPLASSARGIFFRRRLLPWVLTLLLFAPPLAEAARVRPLFNPLTPAGGPFPSDLFTAADPGQNTGRRVNLPLLNCQQRVSECANLAVINTLDGFNVQPRLAIPFSEPIDLATVTSQSVFLFKLSDFMVTGINQVVWDPQTNTLYAESDALLGQHTRYLLIVTNDVRGQDGRSVRVAKEFKNFLKELRSAQKTDPLFREYRAQLIDALELAEDALGLKRKQIVAASLFTTQSVTADLEKIRNQVKTATPAPADFALGEDGGRTVFPLGTITDITFRRQVGTDLADPNSFTTVSVPLAALRFLPGAISAVAFGKYPAPSYLTSGYYIPAVPTRTGAPAVQSTNDVYFTLFLPGGSTPADGWPVAIFGHGFGDYKDNSPFAVAAVMASRGIATIAINVVGHGGGPEGEVIVSQSSPNPSPTAFPSGGRGSDQNGDGKIDSTEGTNALPPRGIIGNRDALRQTVIDLMQLVREIEVGVDVNGDSVRDLNPDRVYYFGQSFGGIYGTIFLAVEPRVLAGVPNVPGGSAIEVARLSPVFRPLVGLALAFSVPPLINVGGASGLEFNENLPLRNQPPVVNNVPGAIEIQQFLEHIEWVQQAGNAVAYAPYLRKQPLDGVTTKAVILQFAKGDMTVPNPTTTAIIRAGDLANATTYFRNDLAFAANPDVPKNPHAFLLNLAIPAAAPIAVGAQQQIAVFFASDGQMVIDPDAAGPLFEVPIVPPLPEELNFLP